MLPPRILVEHALFVLLLNDKINPAKLTKHICWVILVLTLQKWYWSFSPDTNQQMPISLLQVLLSLTLSHFILLPPTVFMCCWPPIPPIWIYYVELGSRFIKLHLHLAPTVSLLTHPSGLVPLTTVNQFHPYSPLALSKGIDLAHNPTPSIIFWAYHCLSLLYYTFVSPFPFYLLWIFSLFT